MTSLNLIQVLQLLLSFFFAIFIAFFNPFLKKNQIKRNNEQIFDAVVLCFLLSIFISRFAFLIENFKEFSKYSWSIYPYFLGVENKLRIWFQTAPWIFFNIFEGGIDIFSGRVVSLIFILFFFRKNMRDAEISKIIVFTALTFLIINSIFYVFFNFDLIFTKKNFIVFEVASYIIIGLLTIFLQKSRKKSVLGFGFFLISWIQAIFMIIGKSKKIGLISLTFLIILTLISAILTAFQKSFFYESREQINFQKIDRNNFPEDFGLSLSAKKEKFRIFSFLKKRSNAIK